MTFMDSVLLWSLFNRTGNLNHSPACNEVPFCSHWQSSDRIQAYFLVFKIVSIELKNITWSIFVVRLLIILEMTFILCYVNINIFRLVNVKVIRFFFCLFFLHNVNSKFWDLLLRLQKHWIFKD